MGSREEGAHEAQPPSARPQAAVGAQGQQSAGAASDASDVPAWVKNLEFLTEPLEGNKANFILQNPKSLRAYFEGKHGKIGQLFATYDRHPPDTALDPQSGVLYFIRTEEGLQVCQSVVRCPHSFVRTVSLF
jgi:hypothetical protein